MGVQVQTATKNGQGKSLSILNRQFISFKYGGKNIEDFDYTHILPFGFRQVCDTNDVYFCSDCSPYNSSSSLSVAGGNDTGSGSNVIGSILHCGKSQSKTLPVHSQQRFSSR